MRLREFLRGSAKLESQVSGTSRPPREDGVWDAFVGRKRTKEVFLRERVSYARSCDMNILDRLSNVDLWNIKGQLGPLKRWYLRKNSRDQIIIIFCDLIKWGESMPRETGGLVWWVVFRMIHLAAGSWTDRSEGEAERLVRKSLQYPGRKDEVLSAGSGYGDEKERTPLTDVEELKSAEWSDWPKWENWRLLILWLTAGQHTGLEAEMVFLPSLDPMPTMSLYI